MSRPQRYIEKLSDSEIRALKKAHRSGKSHTFRCRCQAILLSHQGWSCYKLADFFEVNKVTIYSWLDRWELGGIDMLSDKLGRGRKPILKLSEARHVDIVNQVIDRSARNLNKAISEIEKELGLKMSKKTLKRFLKSLSEDGNDTAGAQQASQIPSSMKRS